MTNQSGSPSFIRCVWRLIYPYWRSDQWPKAWGLLLTVIALDLGAVYISVRINRWYREFYDVLQNYQQDRFWPLIQFFSILATIYILAAVLQIYLGMALRVSWRRWMTEHFFDRWLGHQAYYQLELNRSHTDNPDQRIAEDINYFTSNTLDLSLGLLNAVTKLLAFIGVLWLLSEQIGSTLLGPDFHLSGFLVWAALLYAVIGTVLTHYIGRPLIKLNFRQQQYEADFRFSMMRLRENAESVALYRGEASEKTRLQGRFFEVWQNYWRIMRRQKNLTAFTAGYSQAAVIFPFIVAAPSYFAKQIQMGGVLQITNAFGQVQDSMSWFINAYSSLASWRATSDRLLSFEESIEYAYQQMVRQGQLDYRKGEGVELDGVEIHLPSGETLLRSKNLELVAGEHLLVTGASGAGKSTLFRVLAGIWPFGQGRVSSPLSVLFIPQKPYLPIGSLREILLYPGLCEPVEDGVLQQLLCDCYLAPFSGRLDEVRHWAQMMSPGEQQRLSFVRAILQQPAWLFLDEATSAIDEQTEHKLYQLLKERLTKTTMISIAHRSTLMNYHSQRLHLDEGYLDLQPIG